MKVTPEQVQHFLNNHLQTSITDLITLKGGEWSQAFAFKQTGKDYVVRFGQHHDDYIKDQFATRYASSNLPIPKVIEVGKALGGYFAISERAFGSMIDDQDKAAMRQTIPSLFATMDAIREADISQSHGYGEWDIAGNGKYSSWPELLLDVSNDPHGTKIYGWKGKLKDSPLGDQPFHDAYANLEKLVKDLPEVRTLVHNDLLHFNVIVNDHQITAVIDWANALYGDFLYDLAQFIFWGPLHEPVKGIDWEAEALAHYGSIGLAVPEFRRRLQCCMVHMGLSAQAYFAYKSYWDFFEAVARRTLLLSNPSYSGGFCDLKKS